MITVVVKKLIGSGLEGLLGISGMPIWTKRLTMVDTPSVHVADSTRELISRSSHRTNIDQAYKIRHCEHVSLVGSKKTISHDDLSQSPSLDHAFGLTRTDALLQMASDSESIRI